MVDSDTSWLDKLGGLVKSALGPVIGEKRIPILLEAAGAGLIGGATHGDPYAVDRYWGTINQLQQRKQLEQLWHNLYPDKPMPPGVQSPQDMLPQYSQPGKYGVWEYQPPGMGPPRQVPGTAPTDTTTKPVVRMTEQGLVQVVPGEKPTTQYLTGPSGERLTPAYKPERPERPTVRVFPDGRQRLIYPSGEYVDLPAPEGFQPSKKLLKVGQIANKKYVDASGKPIPPEKGDMTEDQAIAMGYHAVDLPMYRQFPSIRQSMRMLQNIAGTIDTLNRKGKLVQWKGDEGQLDYQIDALGQVIGLKWKALARDPDLRRAQAQTSQMISAMRNLGDKGVRAIQAFEGAMGLMEAGAAPYETIRDFLLMMDNELREAVPSDVPHLLQDYPGATKLPAPTTDFLKKYER